MAAAQHEVAPWAAVFMDADEETEVEHVWYAHIGAHSGSPYFQVFLQLRQVDDLAAESRGRIVLQVTLHIKLRESIKANRTARIHIHSI